MTLRAASPSRTQLPSRELCGLRRCLNFHGCLDCPAIVKGPALQERIHFPSSVCITPVFLPQKPKAGLAHASSPQCTRLDSSLCSSLQDEHVLLISLDWLSQWSPFSLEAVSPPLPRPSLGSITKGNNSKNINSTGSMCSQPALMCFCCLCEVLYIF